MIVRKRDGRSVGFNTERIRQAIGAACRSAAVDDPGLPCAVTEKVVARCRDMITVEEIQDLSLIHISEPTRL